MIYSIITDNLAEKANLKLQILLQKKISSFKLFQQIQMQQISREVEIKETVREKMAEWRQIGIEEMVLQRMTGITNETFKVSAKSHPFISPLIYRKFGESTENVFLERESEADVYLHVSAEGNGPKIYYYGEDVRLEQFIESTVLPSQQMLSSPYLEEVAFALRQFHQLKPLSAKIAKQSLIKRVLLDGREKMLTLLREKMGRDIYTEPQRALIGQFREWVSEEELSFVEAATKNSEEEAMVFSHNDLLANNILIDSTAKKIVFIDYEYASFNYPIYDIANYICQSQINYDVTQPPFFSLTPIKNEDFHKQVRFIEAYVVAKDLSLPEFRANFQDLRKEQRFQKEINKLISLLPLGRMLCNLVWGWWAILVSKNPNISFDYLAFAKKRFDDII